SGRTITLTSDQLTINKNLDIEGPGPDKLAIGGNDKNRVFSIAEGLTVTIAGLTITHGMASGSGSESIGNGGGGVMNAGSALTIANDVFSNNQASIRGGAIALRSLSTLTVTNSSFVGNQSTGKAAAALVEGGAIWLPDEGQG